MHNHQLVTRSNHNPYTPGVVMAINPSKEWHNFIRSKRSKGHEPHEPLLEFWLWRQRCVSYMLFRSQGTSVPLKNARPSHMAGVAKHEPLTFKGEIVISRNQRESRTRLALPVSSLQFHCVSWSNGPKPCECSFTFGETCVFFLFPSLQGNLSLLNMFEYIYIYIYIYKIHTVQKTQVDQSFKVISIGSFPSIGVLYMLVWLNIGGFHYVPLI